MDAIEFSERMAELNRLYSMNLNEYWSERWWKALQGFDYRDVKAAIDQYAENQSLKKPAITDIKTLAVAARIQRQKRDGYGIRKRSMIEEQTLSDFRKTSVIEFCMDVLGVDVVKTEIQAIVGRNPNWSKLVGSNQWVKAYNEKLAELFESAKHFDPEQYERRFNNPEPMQLRAEWE